MSSPKYITRLEFFGVLFGVFAFIFAVHLADEINIRLFRDYLTILIIIVQIICLYCFFKYSRLRK